MESLENNSLYNLIRERAGSEMLRKAESINMYNEASDLLGENMTSEAIDLVIEFHKKYSEVPITPMVPISLMEVCCIDDQELRDLPWIYVHMLETLVSQDYLSVSTLKHRLAASPAAAWRIPLPEGVSNADAFTYVYDDFMEYNAWIESFEIWAHQAVKDESHILF
jgi:hypothetical protein